MPPEWKGSWEALLRDRRLTGMAAGARAAEFAEAGFTVVREAFARSDGLAMCDCLWDVFERRFGIRRQDRSTWAVPFKKGPLEEVGHTALFWSVFSDRLIGAVDEVLGAGCWSLPDRLGDFLITFPNADDWVLPHEGWHSDNGPVGGLIMFVFLSDVGPRGGGTLLAQGSHRLPRADVGALPVDESGRRWKHRAALKQECGWLRDLRAPGPAADRERRFMGAETIVDGVALRVVELTGRAGDVVLVDPFLVHAIAPNAAPVPRFMRTPRVR